MPFLLKSAATQLHGRAVGLRNQAGCVWARRANPAGVLDHRQAASGTGQEQGGSQQPRLRLLGEARTPEGATLRCRPLRLRQAVRRRHVETAQQRGGTRAARTGR